MLSFFLSQFIISKYPSLLLRRSRKSLACRTHISGTPRRKRVNEALHGGRKTSPREEERRATAQAQGSTNLGDWFFTESGQKGWVSSSYAIWKSYTIPGKESAKVVIVDLLKISGHVLAAEATCKPAIYCCVEFLWDGVTGGGHEAEGADSRHPAAAVAKHLTICFYQ
jgi:hypothetical protein